MECHYCQGSRKKKGFSSNKKQRYRCRQCFRYQLRQYKNKAWLPSVNKAIIQGNRECGGIRSLARMIEIAPKTVIARIKKLASALDFKKIIKQGLDYEADEIGTFVGNKENEIWIWICYAIRRDTRKPVILKIGKRNKANLSVIIRTLEQLNPRRIYTDGLDIYKSLIDKAVHRARPYCTNKIERMNLTLRTHIKRLVRRGICFSRKVGMLEACLKLYFWGNEILKMPERIN